MAERMRERKETPAAARKALADLYDELDRELADLGLNCLGCGRCCHFDEAEHILYAGTLERAYFTATPPPSTTDALTARGLRCPFQVGKICLARQSRVLGCRLHFCQASPEQAARLEVLADKYYVRLKRLHDEYALPWDFSPLLPL